MENNEKKQENDFVEKVKGTYASIREHLKPEYRKQYNVRRITGCILVYCTLSIALLPEQGSSNYEVNRMIMAGLLPLIYSIIAFIFWHYSFWSYQGGFVNTFASSIVHIGSFWYIIGKVLWYNFFLLLWISIIAPFSGIKTWLKAVKQEKVLYIPNAKVDVWE